MFDYQLIRSPKRKTLSLQVKYGEIIVRAPHHAKLAFIEQFIEQKAAWLKATVNEQRQANTLCCNFSNGSPILLAGELAKLQVQFSSRSQTSLAHDLEGDLLIIVELNDRYQARLSEPNAKARQVKKQLEKFFKQKAEQVIHQRIMPFIEQTALVPSRINIRQYRARWGSCTNRGELSFNYLLMMAPDWVVDYVIIHELCHLRYLNHSPAFWQLVEKYYPTYRDAQHWLKANQVRLNWRLQT